MKETSLTKSRGGVRPPGLHNDFSEQEESMTASAMPPRFALSAAGGTEEKCGGLRKTIPFEGYGGPAELNEDCTNTFLGRCVEGGSKEEMIQNVDKPLGTNYFRYQPEFMVGKNKGGGNVLDVADRTWSWPLNNAWLQAAVDRGDRIRFISDPAEPGTLYKQGIRKNGLTVTGQELGVLMLRGYAPHEGSGVVQQGYMPGDPKLGQAWEEIAEEIQSSGKFDELDPEAYKVFMQTAQAPARHPKEFKAPSGDIMSVQTNFFGGQPSINTAN